jgi:hypothetical protein
LARAALNFFNKKVKEKDYPYAWRAAEAFPMA